MEIMSFRFLFLKQIKEESTDLESRAFSVVTCQGVNADAWERSNISNSAIDDDVECSNS